MGRCEFLKFAEGSHGKAEGLERLKNAVSQTVIICFYEKKVVKDIIWAFFFLLAILKYMRKLDVHFDCS